MNQTSEVNAVNLVDTLYSRGINIGAIYTPEHGLKGKGDAGELMGDGFYSKLSIPVISLYGKKKKPLPEDLRGIEAIIFDIQDVGVRFYTYISTLHYIMEACAEAKIQLIVLDRPNPNAHYIDGPVLESGLRSFVGMHPVPVVYGMTIGEYAMMINGENWLPDNLRCNLKVVPCKNYTHKTGYDLPVPPSPNLNNMRAIYLYPSVAFFEGTIISEGRGTDSPFQVAGHPDYSDNSFSFVPRSMPGYDTRPKYQDTTCYGIDLRSISLLELKKINRLNLNYLIQFYKDPGIQKNFFTRYFNLLAGNDDLKNQIVTGWSEDEIRNSWKTELEEFKKIRVKYLLYPDE